ARFRHRPLHAESVGQQSLHRFAMGQGNEMVFAEPRLGSVWPPIEDELRLALAIAALDLAQLEPPLGAMEIRIDLPLNARRPARKLARRLPRRREVSQPCFQFDI